jgi:SAM-dependent methyltransferase
MNTEVLKNRYPNLNPEELFPDFPRIPMTGYPELEGYTWEDCHRGFKGAGGLFLVFDTARRMKLEAGMRILDLCCGNCASSIFLAKHFDVSVVAADIGVDPTDNWKRVQEAGLEDRVLPIRMDATQLLLPYEYFDAVFCMNSYFYFGTDDAYLPYLIRFLVNGGRIGIASPCYADELSPETPPEYYFDAPGFAESHAVHSPQWWRKHFEKEKSVEILACEANPWGREYWLDDVRWLVEECHPRHRETKMREMVLQQILMLLIDQNRFVTYLNLVAEKQTG